MQHSSKNLIEGLGSLARTGWLAEQPVDFQERIALAGRWIKVRRRQPLYCVGDPATPIFGLESGLLDVAIQINEEEEVLVHRAHPGSARCCTTLHICFVRRSTGKSSPTI